MIEFYKYLYVLPTPIMKNVFAKRDLKYNPLPNPKTKKYDTDTIAHKAAQL